MSSEADSTSWREVKTDGEDERFERHAQVLLGVQKANARDGKLSRGLHAKAHVGLSATLTVLDDLPERARHGLFAKPGTHRAWVRFSNGAPRRQNDRAPDARGIAIKVGDVDGKKLIPGMENARTQDFLAIRTPATPFRTADEFVAFVAASGTPALLPVKLAVSVGPLRAFAILRALIASVKRRDTSMATVPFFTAAAISCGPHAVRLAIVPVDRPSEEPANDGAPDRDHYAKDLIRRVQQGPLDYELRLQFFRDEATTPIEDHSVEWDTPFVPVARLSILRQDPQSEAGQQLAEQIEGFSFDPWHALVEHRPLGNFMRARNVTYRASTQARGAAPEPE